MKLDGLTYHDLIAFDRLGMLWPCRSVSVDQLGLQSSPQLASWDQALGSIARNTLSCIWITYVFVDLDFYIWALKLLNFDLSELRIGCLIGFDHFQTLILFCDYYYFFNQPELIITNKICILKQWDRALPPGIGPIKSSVGVSSDSSSLTLLSPRWRQDSSMLSTSKQWGLRTHPRTTTTQHL